MSGHRLLDARLRTILDSRGRRTLEAEVSLASGATGRGSAPTAIAPGCRERPLSAVPPLGRVAAERPWLALRGGDFEDEAAFDRALLALAPERGAGANVTLALSLAFWRAVADDLGVPLHRRIAACAETEPAMPRLLVNAFSGGVHVARAATGFQQVMGIPRGRDVVADIEAALALHDAAKAELRARGARWSLSASSGLVVEEASTAGMLRDLQAAIARLDPSTAPVSIGVDVAAEHLHGEDGTYRLDADVVSGAELLERLTRLAEEAGLGYVEDPFAPADEHLWRELTDRLGGRVCVVGDDLFATSAARVERRLAEGIVLKPSQAGAVSATLAAARAARAEGLALCVSHRSGETEDTFICDLAVGLGARWLKLGGPRRGDRVAKYNELLRLAAVVDRTTEPAGREIPSLTDLEAQ